MLTADKKVTIFRQSLQALNHVGHANKDCAKCSFVGSFAKRSFMLLIVTNFLHLIYIFPSLLLFHVI